MGIKIIDMAFDCIEHVLKLLEFRDLLNVAESNRTMQFVTSRFISRRNLTLILCKESEFFLNLNGEACNALRRFHIDGDGVIRTFKFGIGLKILRHFGGSCSSIIIDFDMPVSHATEIEYYLSEYCADSELNLNKIVFENCPKDALKCIHAPLESVQKVVVTGDSEMDFDRLNKVIPNMSSLQLTWLQTSNPKCIEQHFAALRHLEVEVRDRTRCFTEISVKNAIRMNPQLNCVTIKLIKCKESDKLDLLDFLRKHYEAPGKSFTII